MDIGQYFKDAKRKVLRKNQVLHTSHEKCAALGYVASGRIVIKKYLSTGKELLLAELYPGEMYGELLVLTGENYRGYLIAAEPTVVLELSTAFLKELLKAPSFSLLYFRKISERVSRMTGRIEILSYTRVSDRLILFLLDNVEPGELFPVNITALAEELACSREALSRAVSILERTGAIIRKSGGILIEDLAMLENQL